MKGFFRLLTEDRVLSNPDKVQKVKKKLFPNKLTFDY